MNTTWKEKITGWEPAAEWREAGDGMVTLPADRLHAVAARLKEEGFDILRRLTGMDWGEEGLGVVYHLESTRTGENLVLRTLTPDRENPVLDTVCDLWRAAEFNEREAYDYFGIRFLNHPDMRRLFLRDDWVGYPLRKEYDPEQNPLRMSNEVSKDSSPTYELQPDGSYIRKRNVLFEEDEYVINIGPQHPATHGVLRFRVSLEGEIIRKLDVHCGYIHRGIEKMCESLTYPQPLALTARRGYLGGEAVETRYFGGGTPSLCPPEEIGALLRHTEELFDCSRAEETTLEAIPDDLTPRYLAAVRRAGIDRLSIGIQPFDDDCLKLMNRRHTARQAAEAVHNAQKEGFGNITVDLIFGVPGFGGDSLRR